MPGRLEPTRCHAGATARLVVVILAATIGLFAVAAPVAAVTHHALVSSSPSNGSVLDAPPRSITMVFAEDVPDLSIAVTLTGPDGLSYNVGSPEVHGNEVTQHFAPLTVAGEYALAYRIVVPQGPVGDVIRFSVGHGAAKEASALERTSALAVPSDDREPSGMPVLVWGGLGAVLLAIAVTVLVIRRRGPTIPTNSDRGFPYSPDDPFADQMTDAVAGATSSKTLPR